MSKPLSEDLRRRAVEAYKDADGTLAEIAERFRIGTATLKRWNMVWRETGGFATGYERCGQRPTISTQSNIALLKAILEERSDRTYDELAVAWSEAIGRPVSRSATVRHVLKLGYTLRKGF